MKTLRQFLKESEDENTQAKNHFVKASIYKHKDIVGIHKIDKHEYYVHTDSKAHGKQTHSLYLPGHRLVGNSPYADFETYDKPGHHHP